MILSKANLLVSLVTRADRSVPVLDNVHVAADGTTVGVSGKAVMCVSPVPAKTRAAAPVEERGAGGFTMSAGTARDALKLMPPDKQFGGLTEMANARAAGGSAVLEISDGRRSKSVVGRLWTRAFAAWRAVIGNALRQPSVARTRVALNRRRLMHLLDAMDKACPDPTGLTPVFLEVKEGGNIVLRAENHRSGQRALAVMASYGGSEGAWPDWSDWENGLADGTPARRTAKVAKAAK